MSFEEIGRTAGTDKIIHHGYHRFYPQWLESLRETATGILEIGIDNKYSLKLWIEYFKKAFIYGIDIGLEYSEHRVKIMRADQSSIDDLQKIYTQIEHPIQFIIDDGSHIPEHQILTFKFFFTKVLEAGGIYIVEDIETSYWKAGGLYGYFTNYGYKHPASFMEYAKNLCDAINNEFINTEDRVKITERDELLYESISTITFGQNCIIFKKKTESEMMYNKRKYRFEDRLG